MKLVQMRETPGVPCCQARKSNTWHHAKLLASRHAFPLPAMHLAVTCSYQRDACVPPRTRKLHSEHNEHSETTGLRFVLNNRPKRARRRMGAFSRVRLSLRVRTSGSSRDIVRDLLAMSSLNRRSHWNVVTRFGLRF